VTFYYLTSFGMGSSSSRMPHVAVSASCQWSRSGTIVRATYNPFRSTPSSTYRPRLDRKGSTYTPLAGLGSSGMGVRPGISCGMQTELLAFRSRTSSAVSSASSFSCQSLPSSWIDSRRVDSLCIAESSGFCRFPQEDGFAVAAARWERGRTPGFPDVLDLPRRQGCGSLNRFPELAMAPGYTRANQSDKRLVESYRNQGQIRQSGHEKLDRVHNISKNSLQQSLQRRKNAALTLVGSVPRDRPGHCTGVPLSTGCISTSRLTSSLLANSPRADREGPRKRCPKTGSFNLTP
jgi:hypothetical protein